MDDPAVLVGGAGLRVLGQHVDAFNDNLAILLVHSDYLAFFVFILAGDHFNSVALS